MVFIGHCIDGEVGRSRATVADQPISAYAADQQSMKRCLLAVNGELRDVVAEVN